MVIFHSYVSLPEGINGYQVLTSMTVPGDDRRRDDRRRSRSRDRRRDSRDRRRR